MQFPLDGGPACHLFMLQSVSMHCGHGATLTFNPNGENTQVDYGPQGNPEL